MTQKNRIDIGGSVADTFQYTYNYQGQLQSINKNGYPFATYAYDHNNQRIYSIHTQDLYSKKCTYWANGQIIGEGVIDTQNASNNTDFSVRYFYSGNQKVAMERRDMSTGQTSLYYFINNAQGTPALILDNSGGIKSRINLDEWGNLGMLQGPSQEINYTGKKLDVSTGLYYFNQRYYDPEIGRFLQEDPAGQGLNPYRYCGNNPLMYTDPAGLWSIGLKISGVGFSIGDEGISASAIFVHAEVNFRNGDFSAGVGLDFGSRINAFGAINIGYDLNITHTHNFSKGGEDSFAANAGVWAEAGGTKQSLGITYDIRHNKLSGLHSSTSVNLDKALKDYKDAVGEKPNMEPGTGVAGVNGMRDRKPGEAFVKGTIAWGNPVSNQSANLLEWFINDIFPGRENGTVAAIANQIPGQNAFSYLHDVWASAGFGVSFFSVPFAQMSTYGAYIRGCLPENL